MTPEMGMVIGGLAVGAVVFIGKVAKLSMQRLNQVERELRRLADVNHLLTKQLHMVAVPLEGVWKELAFLRSMNQPAGADPEAGVTQEQYQPMSSFSRAPYPGPVMERYAVVPPDAKPEDTDKEGLNQTDDDLVDAERIENLRDRGIQVEDSDTIHPGVVADSE